MKTVMSIYWILSTQTHPTETEKPQPVKIAANSL